MKRRPPQMKARNALAVFGSLAIAASLALEWVSKDVKILALGLALILAGFLALMRGHSYLVRCPHCRNRQGAALYERFPWRPASRCRDCGRAYPRKAYETGELD